MAKKCMIVRWKRTPKYPVRKHNRCAVCGRPRGFLKKFGICRICFRTMAHEGVLPGVTKSSW